MVNVLISIGIAIASSVINALLAKGPADGQRSTEMNAPALNPGQRIARTWGCPGVPGQVVWTRGLIETKHKKKAGGMLGIGAKTYYTYTYSTDIAVSVCIGPQKGIRRIWASDKLLYSGVLVEGAEATTISGWVDTLNVLSRKITNVRGANLKDGKLGVAEQNAITDFIAYVDSALSGIADAAEMIGTATTDMDAAWDALKTYVGGLDFTTGAMIPVSKDALQDLFAAYKTEVDALADMFAYAVEGSSIAYLDGEAIQAATELQNDYPFGIDVFGLIKKAFNISTEDARYDRLNIYRGTASQMPDEIIEADLGVGNVPGYRGVMYFVLKGLQLKDFGNSLPTFKIEIDGGGVDGQVQLLDVVSDLCDDAGLAPSEYSIGRMDATAKVRGFALTDTGTARDALETLRKVFPFDVVESNYRVRFIHRYSPVVARIRREDFGTAEFDNEFPNTFENTRAHVNEMPREIQFTYQDRSREMSTNTAKSRRTSNAATETETANLPMVLKPAEAKEAVDHYLVYKYGARRAYTLNVPVKYFVLDPGDVVQIPRKDNPYGFTVQEPQYRITSSTLGANGIVELGLTDHVVPTFGLDNPAYDPETVLETVGGLGETDARMLDLPLLYDTEVDEPGYYVAFRNTHSGWRGGALYLDNNSGGTTPTLSGVTAPSGNEDWEAVATSLEAAPCGVLMLQANTASPNLWDRSTTLTLFILTPDFTPTASTEAAVVRSGVNRIAVNGEIIQFTDVSEVGNGVWALGNMIRGQFGTESFIDDHAIGSMVVWLPDDAVSRVTHDRALLNVAKDYRAINLTDQVTDASTFQFTSTGVSLKPRAPCFVRRVDDPATGDVTISWQPRARQGGQWKDSADVTLDQASEAYEVEIYNGTTLKRTLAVSDARNVPYTSAQKIADFGGSGPALGALKVRVYQIGAIVGRGFTNQVSL